MEAAGRDEEIQFFLQFFLTVEKNDLSQRF